ncbi:hypothetical protein [Pedobacter namyangjuensis]|uniref:hypothetical protein n=1 Tax=Pedobacter namyangjuensis TaxID=600626 RepID=UPI000DE1F3AD|nr:hypothetical protein [Pedobacter namyangjuensis]
MKKVNLLSKAEMKKVLGGGVPVGGDGCPPSECSNNNDCSDSKYGKTCKITECLSTGDAANYCYTPSAV